MTPVKQPAGDFLHFPVAESLDLYVYPTSRFKSVTLHVSILSELGPDATRFALLLMVLRRGTRRFPTLQALTRHLESLYGAGLSGDVVKRGETHMGFFRLSHPAPAFIPEGETLLTEGIRLLAEMVSDPRLGPEGFPDDIVRQEKGHLRHMILGLENHRDHYAIERMIRVLCRGERFAEYEYGSVDRLDALTGKDLRDFWKRTLRTRPVNLFVVGDVDPDRLAASVNEHFSWTREDVMAPAPTERRDAPSAPRRVEETFPVEQEWLVQGYRIGGDLLRRELPALLYLNGLLGGFAFSRLFKGVRETEGLAYDISSHVERYKGLLIIHAGLKPGSSSHVADRIAETISDLVHKGPTQEEMASARSRLLTEFRSIPDGAGALIHIAQEGILAGKIPTLASLQADVARVTPQDVSRLAASLALDTTFLLKPEKG
ncbi:MAG: EF-P 5-aminopentanol modification-associated protein YfmF [Planctomycetota bacterium]|jgi:predicted Zn-dependent peptidase